MNKDTLYELWTFATRYPYSQPLRSLYLKNLYLLHDIPFDAELRKAVLCVADRRKLFYLIEGEGYISKPRRRNIASKAEVLEEEPGLGHILPLIDAFLATAPEEVSGQISLDYSMDYITYPLQEDEEDSALEQPEIPEFREHELIDGFIKRSEGGTSIRLQPVANNEMFPVGEEEETHHEEDEDNSCFAGTLAKIYTKQHRYSKALEIIKKLSLEYPRKNAYFADRIRFLEKLTTNTKSK